MSNIILLAIIIALIASVVPLVIWLTDSLLKVPGMLRHSYHSKLIEDERLKQEKLKTAILEDKLINDRIKSI